jgi:D-alanyl-lipoteichoic acid acyltransferase DltB (MBOAT superfamily)
MLFNSIEFAVFFPVVTLLYFACPHRFRWVLLLFASCVFYMAFIPAYVLILAFTIAVDYVAGILIEGATGRRRKLFLVASLCANIGVLAVFKYYPFLFRNADWLFERSGIANPLPLWNFILPIGLSFHTFQAMSYTIEVYRGKQAAERHLGIYALYVMFYPQLVAGPIERPQHLLPQFREEHRFEYNQAADGLKLMAWGLFKKVVVADRLALLVNPIYNNPQAYAGFPLAFATLCFAFQIYSDFSGYSDIAIGSAQVMGFRLMENFKRPYFSASIVEFWTRWHISLSTWFRDYLYVPLSRNTRSRPRWYLNLMIVFLISGLWHGANWTFLVWGAVHGAYLILYRMSAGVRERTARATSLNSHPRLLSLSGVATTFVFVSFAWIFFRANSMTDAWHIVTHLHRGWDVLLSEPALRHALKMFGQPKWQLLITAAMLAAMVAVELLQERYRLRRAIAARPFWFRWPLYYALCAAIMFFGQFGRSQFIYFQF